MEEIKFQLIPIEGTKAKDKESNANCKDEILIDGIVF